MKKIAKGFLCLTLSAIVIASIGMIIHVLFECSKKYIEAD